MPLLKDKTILILGSGPTRIGQAGENDQGALEACHFLVKEGCRVITADSNPDAVITEQGVAHKSYVEPLTEDTINQIIANEKPDVLLTMFGGRTGLHLTEVWHGSDHDKEKPQLWATPPQSLKCVLDRDALNSALSAISLKTPEIFATNDVDRALAKAQSMGFPVILRCDDSDIIADGIIVYNQEELREKAAPVTAEPGAVLSVEESLWDWRQVELEILRDGKGKSVLAGVVEYIDNAVIHPGDAIGVTPVQSIPTELIRTLTNQAQAIAEHLQIIGNTTIRFAYHLEKQTILVTAVHPRYTRTSAFISRIKGMPIAGIAALLASGISLDQLPETVADTVDAQWPSDVVAIKWPSWDFDRLKDVPDRIGPQMQAVGQALGIGASFPEAFLKAARAAGGYEFELAPCHAPSNENLLSLLATPSSKLPYYLMVALKNGISVDTLAHQTHIAPWFIQQINLIADMEKQLSTLNGGPMSDEQLRQAKIHGLSDSRIALLAGVDETVISRHRQRIQLKPNWAALPSAPTDAGTMYFATYKTGNKDAAKAEKKSVLILGSGPERIGQGSECDNGVFHAVRTAGNLNIRAVVLNSNLASVTAGHTLQADVYCDALTRETVASIIEENKPETVIAQFAGNQSIRHISEWLPPGTELAGITADMLEIIQSKSALRQHVRKMGIPQPASETAGSVEEAKQKADIIGYPLLLQPANTKAIGAVQLILDSESLERQLGDMAINLQQPVHMERLLEYAIETQAEVLCDGTAAKVVAVMEHIELAGVHAGDSACVLPPYSIGPRHIETITDYAQKVSLALGASGMINLRFAIYRDTVYLLDISCCECRNLPFVTKACNIPMAELITHILLGQRLDSLTMPPTGNASFGVRAPVFPFNVFSEEDPLLGPNMRSTGEVLALSDTFGMAYFKAMEGTETPLPVKGNVLITVTDEDKTSILEAARIFKEQGFSLMATSGTQAALAQNGIDAELLRKLGFGRPNIVDEMKNGRIQMVINTPTGDKGLKDGSYIRKAAIRRRIPSITTPAGAIAAAKGVVAKRSGVPSIRPVGPVS